MWLAAAITGHVHVLEWFFNNGFTNSIHAAHGAATTSNINVLLWTQEHSLGLGHWNLCFCCFRWALGCVEVALRKWLSLGLAHNL